VSVGLEEGAGIDRLSGSNGPSYGEGQGCVGAGQEQVRSQEKAG